MVPLEWSGHKDHTNTYAKYERQISSERMLWYIFKSMLKAMVKVTLSNLCYSRKGLVKRNRHAKYESPIS